MPERRAALRSIAPGVRDAAAALWHRKVSVAAAMGGVLLTATVVVTMWAWRAASRIDLQSLAAPSVVYAAARPLDPGMSLTVADLAGTLARLGYQEVVDRPRVPGEFRRGTDAWDIFLRARTDPGGERPAMRIRLDVVRDHVRAVVDPTSGTPVEGIALEPERVGDLGDLAHRWFRPVAVSALPGHLIDAVLAIEDQRFFEHVGVDLKAIGRAAWVNLRRRKIVQGGSTITQQLVQSFDVGPRRLWSRKIRDALLALAIERGHSKAEI